MQECEMSETVLLGDEAVALAAVHAGLTAAYGYPGTPSTEILEYLIRHSRAHGGPRAEWCANEKTAYEAALGVSYAGRRTLVTMKHVGLNVAADPFMNSALVTVNGGLVVAVADDPGMHSSQNEQDSRVFADFARVVCFEPASHQEAYDMAREAFDVSERFHVPVMLRLVTRLAHSRGIVRAREARGENPPHKHPQPAAWTLLPGNARRQWRALLDRFGEIRAYVSASRFNALETGADGGFGVITTGLARNYFVENLDDLPSRPAHLHIGAYPFPAGTIRAFVAPLARVLLLEEGYPYVERALRGIVPPASLDIQGRESGAVPPDGELNPDIVRAALGLPARAGVTMPGLTLPDRPPQLCAGCPHGDSFRAITDALSAFPEAVVTADIGCSTLGALPPYSAVQTCVCMGASVGMAKGASDAGYHPVVAVIGDSTFLHSGVTPLMDATAANTPMTLIILDNKTVAMTGGQPTIRTSSELEALVRGLGVPPDHFHVVEAHPRRVAENTEILRREVNHRGLSVIIGVRECIETAKRGKQERTAAADQE
jgi:indolepyruvate ferredoxin oxidoreductase alpha subunit